MSYDNAILREQAQGGPEPGGLIPEEQSRQIVKEATESSVVMRLGRPLPRMGTKQRRIPVLSALPHAYFVDGDTGYKQTTRAEWRNVFINAEEIACIVPVPDAVLDDANYDIWGEVRPAVAEAIGTRFDRAALWSENLPRTWPVGLIEQIRAAGHTVAEGSQGDLYDDLLGEDGVISVVENDGYLVTGHASQLTMRGKLRGVRDANGQPIFTSSMQDRTQYVLDGSQIVFPQNGSFVRDDDALMISGDWSKLVYAIRQDITYKVLTESVITDPVTDKIIWNLAQQDMAALRVVFRAGWALPLAATRLAATAQNKGAKAARTRAAAAAPERPFPFAALTAGGDVPGDGEDEGGE